MKFEFGRHLQYGYFASVILSTILLLYLVKVYVGILPAVKGLYVLLGLLLSFLLFTVSKSNQDWEGSDSLQPQYLKALVTLLVLSFPIIILTGSRTVVLLGLFPIIYAFIAVQLQFDTVPQYALAGILGTFLVALAAKYIDTYRFFGNGDLFGHTASVKRMVATGSTSAIVSPYQFYPGLHITSGSVKIVGGTTPYDALLLTGIIAATSAVILSYLFGRIISGSQSFGMLVALGMSVSYQFQFFGLYVFPQTLAVVLGFLAIYLALKSDNMSRYARFGIAGLIVMAAMAFTHHFTFVLFAPILGVLLLVRYASKTQLLTRINEGTDLVSPRAIPLVTGGMIALSYWIYNEHKFFSQLLFATGDLIFDRTVVASSSGGPTTTFPLGVEITEQTLQQALFSVVTPSGIYFTLLLAVFSLGIAESLRFTKQYRRLTGYLLIGIAGSLLILKTPVALSIRLGHPFTLFFSVVLAVGLLRLLSTKQGKMAIPVLVIVILGTTAPIVAGGDLHNLHQGPDFYGSDTSPDAQRDFSELEYDAMRSTADFVESYNRPSTSMWMSSVAFGLLDASIREGAWIDDCAIQTQSDALFYRTKWKEHQVYFNGTRNKMIISKASFHRMVASENKIHTTGVTGILFDRRTSSFETGCI